MADLVVCPVELGGWFGAPGYNVLHAAAPAHGSWSTELLAAFLQDVYDSYNGCMGFMASGVTVDVPDVVNIINSTTGTLIDVMDSGETYPVLTASGSGAESRASQANLRLNTSDIRDGRIVRGRIFLGPLASTVIGTNGLLTTSAQEDIDDAWSGTTDPLGGRLVVWSRPSSGASDGAISDVNNIRTQQRPATLRNRNR